MGIDQGASGALFDWPADIMLRWRTNKINLRMPILFLPGAGGSAGFWKPVADQLKANNSKHFFGWPGLGNEPPDPSIRSVEDLVDLVLAHLEEPASLVGQSMGGYIALRVALERPEMVRHIVLTVASAGLAMNELGAINWRKNYAKNFPASADWITEPTEDLSLRLNKIDAPCLLLWGGADPISPVAVGQRLAFLLPSAHLHVIDEADHDLALTHANVVAELIDQHLA